MAQAGWVVCQILGRHHSVARKLLRFRRSPGNFPGLSHVRTNGDPVTARPKPKTTSRGASTAARVSWFALVAATTLGAGAVHHVRAAVSADTRSLAVSEVGYRLIVQSYAPESFGSGARGLPTVHARPLASTQRAVTREELARGIAVDVVGVSTSDRAPVIVAWVERGKPNLEYDALRARPSQDAVYGVALGEGEPGSETSVVLTRRIG